MYKMLMAIAKDGCQEISAVLRSIISVHALSYILYEVA